MHSPKCEPAIILGTEILQKEKRQAFGEVLDLICGKKMELKRINE